MLSKEWAILARTFAKECIQHGVYLHHTSTALGENDMNIIPVSVAIACYVAFSNTSAFAQSPINPQRFPIRDLHGGDSASAIEKVLASGFQSKNCSARSCKAATVEKNASQSAVVRDEGITVYFNEAGEAFNIKYQASYAKGADTPECRPHLDSLRADMLSRYGSPWRLEGPDAPSYPNKFVAVWSAEGAPKNQTPTVVGEYMNASAECRSDGTLFVKSEFRSNAIESRGVSRETSSAKPAF